MQEYMNEEIVKTELLSEHCVPPMQKGSTHQVIANLPRKGEIIVVHGLQFKVTHSDTVQGKFFATICKPGLEENVK